MFQLNGIDDRKTVWNLKESQAIIPLMNEDSLPKERGKIVRTVNFIPEDNQINPTGNSDHSLIFGFDKNLFEQQNTNTEVLILQDSDLKLLSCDPDQKNQFGYSLSLVNENKSETLWKNPGLKDKPKKWPHDSAILQVKDILIYDEKASEKINLSYLERKSKSFSTKLREGKQCEEIMEAAKNEKDFQLFINCIPKGCSILPKEETENCEILVANVKNKENENTFKKIVHDDSTMPSNNFININGEFFGKESEISEVKERNVIFPEKSLPLKKKAKMKKTMICFDYQRSVLRQELSKNQKPKDNCKQLAPSESKADELHSNFEQKDCNISNFEKLLCNKVKKRKKSQKTSQKLKKMASPSPIQENQKEQPIKFEKEPIDSDLPGFDIKKFRNIYDLVEGLRQYRMISVPVWQLLNTGLKEMNMDILKEIIKNKSEPEGGKYSPQLKAFALVVYFKQPVAFNFLAKVYKNGWPSLNVIKEWKLQLNSHHRPNFVGMQRKNESDVS